MVKHLGSLQRFGWLIVLGAFLFACSSTAPADETDTTSGTDATTTEDGDNLTDLPEPEADAVEEIAQREGPCTYPTNTPSTWTFLQPMPYGYWPTAYGPEGQMNFDLEEFMCGDAYEEYRTAIFIVGSGWCPNCPNYMAYVAGMKEDLDKAGALLVFVEKETHNLQLATDEYADAYCDEIVGEGVGIRVGSANMKPTAAPMMDSDMFQTIPEGFVVRKRDMKIIATQESSDYMLPFDIIVNTPEKDWSDPNQFTPNCDEDDEESYEPNDSPDVLGDEHYIWPGAPIEGGICTAEPDFYKIQMGGAWRINLDYDTSVGELEIFVWDVIHNTPMRGDDGKPIKSVDTETGKVIEFENNATIMVTGYGIFSTTYTMTVTWPLDE